MAKRTPTTNPPADAPSTLTLVDAIHSKLRPLAALARISVDGTEDKNAAWVFSMLADLADQASEIAEAFHKNRQASH
jgi:hypothetical protein